MTLHDLYFSYGEKIILDGFSFVFPGALVTMIKGASGCGKTTLLKLLGGLLVPEGGEISCIPPARDIAFLFQEDRLIPGLSAVQQIQLVFKAPLKSPSSLESARKLLDIAGLKEAKDMPPEELSGGMRRRLALMRCLAYGLDKKLLLLDEPFSGIDFDRASSLMQFIKSLNIPVIYSAHEEEMLSLADSIVTFAGPPLRVIQN